MLKMQVSSLDSRTFFDKVIDYIVEHNLCTISQREKMAEECNELHPDLCSTFGFNPFDIGQTLEVAKIVKQLLSVRLEKLSGGNVALAVKALQKNPVRTILVNSLKAMRVEYQRVIALAETSQKALTIFNYSVVIYKGRPQEGKRTKLIPLLFPADNFLEQRNITELKEKVTFWKFCQSITTNFTLEQLREDIADAEYELAVSKKFLPWDMLIEEAGLTSWNPEEVKMQYVWTAETLMASMITLLVTGGSNIYINARTRRRSMGTMVPSEHLEHLSRSIKTSSFNREANEGFSEYLRSRVQKNATDPIDWSKMPNNKEMAHLQTILDRALDLLFSAKKSETAEIPIGAWTDRVHIAYDKSEVRNQRPKGMGLDKPTMSRGQSFLQALEKGTKPWALKKRFSKISWEELHLEGLTIEIIERTDGEVLLTHLPLFPSIISIITDVWETSTGQRLWPKKQREELARRAMEGGSDIFWVELGETAVKALATANPILTEAILERESNAIKRHQRT